MSIYTKFWEDTLKQITKKINTGPDTNFVLDVSQLSAIGDRGVSGFSGRLTTWAGEIEIRTNSAPFRSLEEVINSFSPFKAKIPGVLELRIKHDTELHVAYKRITYENIIERYKSIPTDRKNKEVYKWQLVKKFQDAWVEYQAGAISFSQFWEKFLFKNLVFTTGITVLNHTARDKPRELEQLLLALFDESVDLTKRIEEFKLEFEKLYYSLPNHGPNLFLEERTFATLLTFRYPEKYTFFKVSFYTKLCRGLGIDPQKPGSNLIHYYQLVEDFLDKHLVNYPEVIDEKTKRLDSSCYPDTKNLILTQDIFFLTLDAKGQTLDEEEIIDQPIEPQVKKQKMNHPLNQILYGPPGTGKTYHTVLHALNIIEEKGLNSLAEEDREVLKERFDKYSQDKRIFFTTFHQSMSYEDFIEGIKPYLDGDKTKEDAIEIAYQLQPGLFKRCCALAAYQCYSKWLQGRKPKNVVADFDTLYDAFIADIEAKLAEGSKVVFETIRGAQIVVVRINKNDSIITQGINAQRQKAPPPKTKSNFKKLYDAFNSIEEIESLDDIKMVLQIQPGISGFYAVFAGLKEFEKNFKPTEEEQLESEEKIDEKEIVDQFEDGVFDDAVKEVKDADAVVLIIDEINRGNIAAIFGELITLIETDKRWGAKERLKAILPYSKKEFYVPSNLYVIGTMNTADRSVEALDTALRRRFVFKEMLPAPNVIQTLFEKEFLSLCVEYHHLDWESEEWKNLEKPFRDIIPDKGYNHFVETIKANHKPQMSYEEYKKHWNSVSIELISVSILKEINQRIEVLSNRDHSIGHSYFLGNYTLDGLKQTMYKNIIPLLQEYFFGDYSKIGLVLGSGFVTTKFDEAKHKVGFASFNYDDTESLQKTVHEIVPEEQLEDFGSAIENLLNRKPSK